MNQHSATPSKHLVRWPRSTGRRVLFVGVYLLFLLLLAAVVVGVNWTRRHGLPVASQAAVWEHYYPELSYSGVLEASVRRDDDVLDVLILGGSTLAPAWSTVGDQLQTGLEQAFPGTRVRVFNLAEIAHTSRDSLNKFSRLTGKPLDLVVVYDGFNDCRMNNCPPAEFRDDYSHCSWYRAFEKRRKSGVMRLSAEALGDVTTGIGFGEPELGYAEYGSDLKTPRAFRQNLKRILEQARSQHSLVVLQTFAWYVPENYSEDRFKAGELDYAPVTATRNSLGRHVDGRCPVELWGLVPNVIRCVTAHNQEIRRLAQAAGRDVVFVDQETLMSKDGRYFTDACHLSEAGSTQFVRHLLPAVTERLRQRGWR